GMGFLVFYLNPRGSDGYGEVFRRAVVRDWGGLDYVDLMTSLDQLIERTGCIDTKRLGIGGGSYGGYMTNWAIGQTDRFAAAVAMRPLSNLVSEYAQHDIVLWGELELGPPPWPDTDELWRRSPIPRPRGRWPRRRRRCCPIPRWRPRCRLRPSRQSRSCTSPPLRWRPPCRRSRSPNPSRSRHSRSCMSPPPRWRPPRRRSRS